MNNTIFRLSNKVIASIKGRIPLLIEETKPKDYEGWVWLAFVLSLLLSTPILVAIAYIQQ